MARELMYPLPVHVRDHVEGQLYGIADQELRYKVREIARRAYAEGYTIGHMDGVREVYADKQAEKDAEAAKADGAGVDA